MLRTINNPVKLSKACRTLTLNLLSHFSEKIYCTIGYHGGSFQKTVNYSDELDLWYATWNHKGICKNLFGIGRPNENGSNSMTGQINIPIDNLDRSIAGALALSDDGDVYLLHRGNIGGGKSGIGKSAFLENFRGDLQEVDECGKTTNFCVIGQITSIVLADLVKSFIEEIGRVKSLLRSPSSFDIDQFRFNDENGGRYILGDLSRGNGAERTHYMVVNALAELLENQGLKVGNDRNRDLFIHDSRCIRALFEIKTSLSSQNLYSAVGQLLIYSIPISTPVSLILVIPDRLEKSVQKRLAALGISVLYFKWSKNYRPHFSKASLAKLAFENMG